jgi:two-component system, OmpR family, sensor histidine kinase SenX3
VIQLSTIVAAGIAAVTVMAVLALIGMLFMRAAVRRRVDNVALRLGGSDLNDGGRGLEGAISRLERATERAMENLDARSMDAGRFCAGLEHVREAVIVYDEHGDEVFRNEAAQRLAEARHAEALVAQEIEDQVAAALGGTPQQRTIDLFGPPRRMLVISAAGLDDGTRSIGALAVVEDVSEKRRLEAVRRDFVANISHELKTPVGALGLLAETIVTEEDPSVTRRLAERMTAEAFRVARTIDDLLDLSRIEAEESPQREPVAVDLVVAEAADRVSPLAESRAITIETGAVPTGPTVSGDRRQLVSAVANLLENACKYSEKGTSVEVAARIEGDGVEIDVRDHGIGIPSRDLERVFERFYRVDRARSRDTGGTGLGLAIVRHVAGNHGGEVRVDSHEGEGSTFTLRLPAGTDTMTVSEEVR